MRRAALLPLAVLALAVPASVASCGCGKTDCSRQRVNLVVQPGVEAVEMCGAVDDCTTTEVGDWAAGMSQQSIAMQPPPLTRWSTPPHRKRPPTKVEWWTVRALDAEGHVLIEQVLVPEFVDRRGCRCGANIEIEVLPSGIRQTGTGKAGDA